jgi:hypothetical protein
LLSNNYHSIFSTIFLSLKNTGQVFFLVFLYMTAGFYCSSDNPDVDVSNPGPSTSAHQAEEQPPAEVGTAQTPECSYAGSERQKPNKNKITSRDGKTAMAVKALKEQISQQNEILKQKIQMDNAILAELKRNNDLKEEANSQREKRLAILTEQVALLKELLNK